MVDFSKLRSGSKKARPIEPTEIFRRLPKSPGINDLYTSQADVLKAWFGRRAERDVVVKLHTGGGKTLVGLLIAQSSLHETNEPVLYLSPTTQLVNQTLEKARSYGVNAVGYVPRAPLDEAFLNGSAIMVATYSALFNGKSKFGIRGGSTLPTPISTVVMDDAHAAFAVVREAFTATISRESNLDRYESLAGLFRLSFKEIDRVGSFDDVVSGSSFGVLEVPYWAWREKLDSVRELLRGETSDIDLVWPMLRDNLHLCHALVSRSAFTITPILPIINAVPAFFEAARRVYMSATIADDSELIRSFGASAKSVSESLSSRSLAGISERMIIIPELMPVRLNAREVTKKILTATAERKMGAVVLVPSGKMAQEWTDVAAFSGTSKEVEVTVSRLQAEQFFGPAVFANRYDGIDLPGNSCRLLVMEGLPTGTSDYELFRAGVLYGGSSITRLLAQRIEQGIGRGARGAGDHCVVILLGNGLAAWIAKAGNYKFLTSATRAQLDMGQLISKSIESAKELGLTINKSYKRDKEWTEYHADTLADLVDENAPEESRVNLAFAERRAFDLWQDGHFDKAITLLDKAIDENNPDVQTRGWLEQFAARIADAWLQRERSEELQRRAFASNRNMLRPKVLPPYRPLPIPGPQSRAIVAQIAEYRPRRGFIRAFEEVVANLNREASANQFEQALEEFGRMIGLSAQRHDTNGEGPDVLWLLPSKVGFVIEAKSRKKATAALKKVDHGQLLVAREWFSKNYREYRCVAVSVHPQAKSTKAASAHASRALTYEKLGALISDARAVLARLVESQLPVEALVAEASALLEKSNIRENALVESYLQPFEEVAS